MAVDITLSAWLTNMIINTSTTPDQFEIPLTDIGITDGAGEDDIHEFVRALLVTLQAEYDGLASADKPVGFKITKQSKINPSNADQVIETLTVVCVRDIETTDAIAE